jgi:aldehyde dehydrogenase (NAD+)
MENQKQTEIASRFNALQANAAHMAQTTASQRRAMLKKLLEVVLTHRVDIQTAMHADYGRHAIETDLAETWVVVKEIKFAMRHLAHWMRPKRVPTSVAFFGARAQINYEAKGVALIISPWNFPFNLSLSPLVSAIAAGNTVLIKPSEFTPHSSALIKAIVDEALPPNVAFVAEGGLELSKTLISLPFNHIFFTGSPVVGTVVMKAAADNLASVTLELGGKSPSVVDAGVNVAKVAKQIVFSKFTNSGQVCIATDFVLVHEKIKDQFLAEVNLAIASMYPNGTANQNPEFARVVDKRHALRIKSLVIDAVEKGAQLSTALQADFEERYISPIVLTHVHDEMNVMQNEIFGPILPIKTFANHEAALAQLQQGD